MDLNQLVEFHLVSFEEILGGGKSGRNLFFKGGGHLSDQGFEVREMLASSDEIVFDVDAQ